MSVLDQKYQEAAKQRDHALRELIRPENDPHHYDGRIEALRNYANSEKLPAKQKKMRDMAASLENKRTTLFEKQRQLQLNYDRANRELAEQISRVRDPDERLNLARDARRRQEVIHLKEAGKTPSSLNRKNMKTTIKFMEQNGASQKQIQAFAKGTDFSQAVKVERLPVGKSLSQRVYQGGRPGPYYSDPGVAANRVGISNENREHRRFQTSQPTEVLSSKAAAVHDSWSNRAKRQPTRGGNTQYWIPRKEQSKLRPVTVQHKVKSPKNSASTIKTSTKQRSISSSEIVTKKKTPISLKSASKQEKIIRRKGASNDIAIKNGRGKKVPNNQIKRRPPRLK